MIAARQIFLGRGGAKLPYDAEVEWIGQSGDTQYIKTGIVPPVGSILRCEFQFTDTRNSFNAIGNIGNVRFGFGIELGTFKVCTAGWKEIIAEKDTNWHTWTIDEPNGIASLDNTSVSINAHSEFTGDVWANNGGFLLFQRLTSSGGRDYSTNGARCKSLYIGTSSGALFDGIPVRFTNELGQSEGAMYDRVSGQLFRNQGTGAFLYGGDVYSVPVETSQYVQEGLVAMWDGKENFGKGLRCDGATMWESIVSESNHLNIGNAIWTNDSLSTTSAHRLSVSGANKIVIPFNGDGTIELCFSVVGYPANYGWILDGGLGLGNVAGPAFSSTESNHDTLPDGTVCGLRNWVGNSITTGQRYTFTASYSSGGQTKMYTDAVGSSKTPSGTISGVSVFDAYNYGRDVYGNIYCIRQYSRVLTDAEIAANYAVDKARFNLP